MSAQSGISVSPELARDFAEAVSAGGNVRLLVVAIENELAVTKVSLPPHAGRSDVDDFELIDNVLEDEKPAYILYRLAEPEGGSWLFISYVPDVAKVREKMLYASTRATISRQLGGTHFRESIFATSKQDLTPKGYLAHLASCDAKPPMTLRERELADIKAAESLSTLPSGTEARSSNVWGAGGGSNVGIGLKWSSEAQEAFQTWCEQRGCKSVQFNIELGTETIVLSDNGTSDELRFPESQPSYTFYHFSPAPDQVPLQVFIYACPVNSPVKSRLVYSSSSNSVAGKVSEYGIQVSKKLETSDPDEINEDYIRSELGSLLTPSGHTEPTSHPPLGKPAFAKPARPGRRR
ncbi:hypothetical protein CROQUDRAFT_653206 [Cronartium quercuum f. sp. fusiforme G11]|uniref:ADF-H domain-containing protein n=1 Tax=Cronartium quercuum f. sp. fusiforme G11 TaxID=708437 RepID=A0A9P6NMK1_9BASI|nr:hypothetical protein CROQUDRAFT_653206 [Cronartium quercuum f. sp. fusiforme G11]